jgi:hypothetical protein
MVEVHTDVDGLAECDLQVLVVKQIQPDRGLVGRRRQDVEAAVAVGPEALGERDFEIGADGNGQLQLLTELAKTPERVGVVLFEVAERGPERPHAERDVGFDAAELEVRVERDVGHARRPTRVVVAKAGGLKPVAHPADDRFDMLLLGVEEDLGPVLLLQPGVREAVVVGIDRSSRPVRDLQLRRSLFILGAGSIADPQGHRGSEVTAHGDFELLAVLGRRRDRW